MLNTVKPGAFSCAPFIKEIGRGKDGARSLSQAQAQELFSAILAGQVSELELGAILIALRVKGETAAELSGFLVAIKSHPAKDTTSADVQGLLKQLNCSSQEAGKPVVIIPSYNGARRKPNFTPLLAGLLTQRGYPVLVHGLGTESQSRVTSERVFEHVQWRMPQPPVYVSMRDLSPALAAILELRNVLGVRNCAHTLAKLFVPSPLENTLLVTAYTHPEFWNLQREVLADIGQTALVLRGHEGEPVSAPYRTPRMDGVKHGKTWCIAEPEALFSEQPDPRPDTDAKATAELIARWLESPADMPHGFLRQVDAIEAVADA